MTQSANFFPPVRRLPTTGVLFNDRPFAPDGTCLIRGNPLMMPMHDSYKPPCLTPHPSVRVIPSFAELHVTVR